MPGKASATKWIVLAAAAEAAGTGLVLFLWPRLFGSLLFGSDLADAGQALARLTAIVMVGLVVATWPAPDGPRASSVRALSIYNLLAAVYLLYLPIGGHSIGILLWPAVVIHAALSVLLGRAWLAAGRK